MKNLKIIIMCIISFSVIQIETLNADTSERKNTTIDVEKCSDPTALIEIPDRNLDQAISDVTGGNRYYTVEQLQSVKSLWGLYDINDLSGLECATELEMLKIKGGNLTNIDPLINLNKLEEVTINSTKLNDLSGAQGLSKIKVLNLADNQISDVNGLSKIGSDSTKAIILILDNNLITNIDPLTEIDTLYLLSVANNQITGKFPAFNNLPYFKNINLENNKINDVSNLRLLNKEFDEYIIRLSSNQLTDVSSLSGYSLSPYYDYINAHNQEVEVPKQIIDSNDMLYFKVYDENGKEYSYELGIPNEGMNYYTVEYDTGFLQGKAELTYEYIPKDKKGIPEFAGLSDKMIKVNQEINLLEGVTANDKEDGDLTNKIKVDDNQLNLSQIGKYQVTYSVIDSDGNETTASIEIIVIPDNTIDPPEPLEPEIPEVIEPEIPEVIEPEIPEVIDPEIPEVINPEIPEVIEPDMPEVIEPDMPEVIDPDMPEVVDPEGIEPEIVNIEEEKKIENLKSNQKSKITSDKNELIEMVVEENSLKNTGAKLAISKLLFIVFLLVGMGLIRLKH